MRRPKRISVAEFARIQHNPPAGFRQLQPPGWWLAAIAMVLGITSAHAAQRQLPLSAPVKSLSSGSGEPQAAPSAVMAEPGRPQPTMPGGKLPQYRLDHRYLALPSASQRHDARLRLIVALPTQPILLEASITIDGQPFRMARERRVQQIVEQAEASGTTSGPAVPERIRQYRQAKAEPLSAEEVHWLLTNWVEGPALLMLNENFQRFRANQRPVYDVLDRDRDGTIAADELERAVESFRECDLNRNDLVEYTELAEAADDPRSKKPAHAGPGKLVFRLPDENSAAATYRRLATHYATQDRALVPRFDGNADGGFDADELAALRDAPADVSLRVAFDSADPDASRIICTAVDAAFAEAAAAGRQAGGEIALPLAGALLAFSAVQDGASDQVSLGAVNDGYPLLPRIDPNEDGRLTLRELRGLVAALKQFDRNRDGRLTADEAPPTIRICFGLGPHVHRELAGIRRLRPAGGQPIVAGPEWFVRMDRNQDKDLTRGEFPGTDEQFRALDFDRDELISAEEANRFENESNVRKNNSG
jgi:hypothetical protein